MVQSADQNTLDPKEIFGSADLLSLEEMSEIYTNEKWGDRKKKRRRESTEFSQFHKKVFANDNSLERMI